jgi:enoyl-CoA hydratase/carnithine racemase
VTDGRVVRSEIDEHVALLTITREAKRNALTWNMIRELESHASDIQADNKVRSVVLTGAGGLAFSAGGDLESLIPAALDAGHDTLNPDPSKRFLSDLRKPVVAAVRGACFGAGFELLLGTDLRIVAHDARFGLPEAALGMIPGDGTHVRLPQQVPMAVAKELLLLGATLDADRALQVGLVNEVLHSDDVVSRAVEVAAKLAILGPIAVQTSKEIVTRIHEPVDGFVLEHAFNARVLSSADAREGVEAFRARRPPRFTGR